MSIGKQNGSGFYLKYQIDALLWWGILSVTCTHYRNKCMGWMTLLL